MSLHSYPANYQLNSAGFQSEQERGQEDSRLAENKTDNKIMQLAQIWEGQQEQLLRAGIKAIARLRELLGEEKGRNISRNLGKTRWDSRHRVQDS